MIKSPSALDSIERRGLLHDGKLGAGGIVVSSVKQPHTNKSGNVERNAQIENVTHKRNAAVKNVTALSNAERQKLYRQRKREAKK